MNEPFRIPKPSGIERVLVGGVAAGQVVTVSHEPLSYIQLPAPIHSPMKEMVEVVTYKLCRLGGERYDFTCYALDGMDGDQVIAELLKGYKNNDHHVES